MKIDIKKYLTIDNIKKISIPIVLCLMVGIVSFRFFGKSIEITYLSENAAGNYLNAVRMFEAGGLRENSILMLPAAIFIKVGKLFIENGCKLFVIYNIVLSAVELLLIYFLFARVNNCKGKEIINGLLTILYFLGHPIYMLHEGFSEWTLLNIVVIALLHFGLSCKKEYQKRYLITGSIVLVLGMIYNLWKHGVTFLAKLFLIEGDVYSSPFGDVIYFVPIVVALILLTYKKVGKERRVACYTVTGIVITVFLYVGWWNDVISTCFIAKWYSILWILGWLSVTALVSILMEKKQMTELLAYGGMIVFLAITSAVEIENILLTRDEQIRPGDTAFISSGVPSNFLALFHLNVDSLREPNAAYLTEQDSSLIFQSGQILRTEIPLIVPKNLSAKQLWYDAETETDSDLYREWENSIGTIIDKLNQNEERYVALSTISDTYLSNTDFWEMQRLVYDSQEYRIYTYVGNDWIDTLEEKADISEGDRQLCEFINESFASYYIPVVAEDSLKGRILYYDIMTGNSSDPYIGWNSSDLKNLGPIIFEANQVEMFVLFKDTSMYIENEDFLADLEILFETENACVYSIREKEQ